MKPKRILLTGFRGSGKSTVGRILAKELGLRFVDADEVFQKREKRSISEFVKEFGWEAFRAKEREIMREMSDEEGVVIALGGGAVTHEEEMELLKREGLCVWLSVKKETVLSRVKKDSKSSSQRPSLTGLPLEEEVELLLKRRTPLYKKFADVIIATDEASPEEVAKRIKELLS